MEDKIRYTMNMDKELHGKFKLWCLISKQSMQGVIHELLEKFIAEMERREPKD